jgi:hypothetical protein
MATVLSIIQDLAEKFPSIGVPTSLVTTNNRTVRQFKALLNEEGQNLAKEFLWTELRKEYTFDLVADQEAYTMPVDFSRIAFDTSWDRDGNREMIGGLSPREWQIEKSALVSTGVYKRFTIKGSADSQFYISPIPSASEAGNTIAFEYYTKSWLRPAKWLTSTTYAAGAYTWYNGNYYTTTSGGTSGATAPTHTMGSASDGGVTWDCFCESYEKIMTDTDVPLLEASLIGLGVLWRFMRIVGLGNYQDYRAEYDKILTERKTALLSPRTINLAGKTRFKFLSSNNLPDTITGV